VFVLVLVFPSLFTSHLQRSRTSTSTITIEGLKRGSTAPHIVLVLVLVLVIVLVFPSLFTSHLQRSRASTSTITSTIEELKEVLVLDHD
jgi:hypothetical protein